MKKALLQTFGLIFLAALINLTVFAFISRVNEHELIGFIQGLSFACAVPVVFGLLLSHSLAYTNNILLKILNILVIIGNGCLLITGLVLVLLAISYDLLFLLALLYVSVGFFVFFKTLAAFKYHKKEENLTFSSSDILDDNFGEL